MNQSPPFHNNNNNVDQYHHHHGHLPPTKNNSSNVSIPKCKQVMLLPTKVYCFAGNEIDDHRSYKNGFNNLSNDNNGSFVPTLVSTTSSHWTAQPVLEWIESLAIVTTNASYRNGCSIDTIIQELAQPTPDLCKITLIDAQAKMREFPPIFDERTMESCRWDLSFLFYHDPSSWMYIRKVQTLAGHVECMMDAAKTTTSFDEMSDMYQMIQTRLSFTFDRIMWQKNQSCYDYYCPTSFDPSVPTGNKEETRFLLDSLYEEICDKLEKLIVAFESPIKRYDPKPSSTNEINHHCSGTKPMNKHQTKQELGKYMTSWLRENFTNPYPDDDGLVEMANHCGTTNQVISNWLINARTRKWRPAIIKATELNRPADMLLEDSMNIFDNKPIRVIHFDTTTATAMNTSETSLSSQKNTMNIISPGTIISTAIPYPSIQNPSDMHYQHDISVRTPPPKRQRLLTVDTTSTTTLMKYTNEQQETIMQSFPLQHCNYDNHN